MKKCLTKEISYKEMVYYNHHLKSYGKAIKINRRISLAIIAVILFILPIPFTEWLGMPIAGRYIKDLVVRY